ncbi:MAG: hypothetical protein R2830_19820 [Saprospiraceae bacterium]
MPTIPAPAAHADKSGYLLKWIIFGACSLALLVVKFGYHEMWKDEWQAWLMARDMGWGQLTASLFYEGHPALWYYYLKIWTTVSSMTGLAGDATLQLAHAAVVIAAYAIFVFKFRLPLWLKACILPGYYLFFEYGVVNRGYALVVLLAFLATILVKAAGKKPLQMGLVLLLLCQTEVFGAMIACALFFYFLLDRSFFKKPLVVFKDTGTWQIFGGLALGLMLFTATVYPRGEQEALSQAYASVPFSLENIGTAFQGNLANTFLIGAIPDTNVFGVSAAGVILSCLVLVLLSYLFWAGRKVWWTWLAFTVVFFLFGAGVYPGGVRQWGMALVFFVICLELRSVVSPTMNVARTVVVVAVLGCQLYYSGMALLKEWQYPFSQAKNAASFILAQVPGNVPIVAINKFAATPVIGYAGRKFYELPKGEAFSYFKWLEKIYLPPEQELKLFAQFKKVGGIVIVTDKPLDPARYPSARLWKSFDGFNLKNENYYLYALER